MRICRSAEKIQCEYMVPLRSSKVQLTLNSVPFVCACEWEPCGGQRWFKCLPLITVHLRLDGFLADLARLADKTIFYRGSGDETRVLMLLLQQVLVLLKPLASFTPFWCSQDNSGSREAISGRLPAYVAFNS